MHTDIMVAPLELKFAGSPDAGEFEGYGAFFGNIDLHGDRILPGAFSASLAEGKAAGRSVPMHVNHGLLALGGQRGVGVWSEIGEDAKGLRVKGKISGMNTDAGRHLFERVTGPDDDSFSGLEMTAVEVSADSAEGAIAWPDGRQQSVPSGPNAFFDRSSYPALFT
ncbi:HK97 family phage prohead protease [Methylorubrum populi]